MGAFCGKCGGPLNENGVCPRCASPFSAAGDLGGASTPPKPAPAAPTAPTSAPRPAEPVEPKRAAAPKSANPAKSGGKKKKKKGGKRVAIFILVLALVAALVIGGIYLLVKHVIKGGGKNAAEMAAASAPVEIDYSSLNNEPPEGELEPIELDVAQYFGDIGEVEAVIDAKDAEALSEEEAIHSLAARGFTEQPVIAYYTEDGAPLDEETEASGDSFAVHPVYETYYFTEDGAVWRITLTNGAIQAVPVSFMQDGNWSVPVMLAETESIMCYDPSSNSFYRVVPDDAVYDLKSVERIDAQFLEDLSAGEVRGL